MNALVQVRVWRVTIGERFSNAPGFIDPNYFVRPSRRAAPSSNQGCRLFPSEGRLIWFDRV